MKKIYRLSLGSALALISVAALAVLYTTTLVNEPALTYSKDYTLNLSNTPNSSGMNGISAQAIYSTVTVPTNSFNDGRVSTATITVSAPTALLSAAATNQITLSATSVLLAASATDYLTVLSTQSLSNAVITYGPNKVRQGHEWTTGTTTDLTAASITTAMNKYHGLTAVRTNSVIALSLTPGAAGNGKALSVNVSSITAGGTTFGGGYDSRIANAIVTANGQRLRQGYEWFADTTSSGTATNLAAILNKVTGVHANAAGSVVYSTATVAGTAGNAYTLVSNAPSYVAVAHPTYSGGKNNAYIRINGVTLTQGTNWTAVATATGTARAISNAIMANSNLNTIISSTWTAGGVVIATSTFAGASQNYPMVTNYPSNLVLSNVSMTGGLTPAWLLNSSAITVASHGLSTGFGVTFSTGSGVALSPLVNGTVYYAAKIDANTIALATSKNNAVAGTYITLTSTTTTGPHTYTLTPQAYSGTAGLQWFGSIDGTNYNPVNVSSVTYSSPSSTPSSTLWDFGTVNYKYLRLSVTGPTTGGLSLVVTVTGNTQ